MYTIAFIGPSGTGKSHRSVTIANEVKAEAIIDDGLLISKNKVLAGYSAKKEATKLAAVRRALFTRKEHIEDVKRGIKENNLNSIMILGTSLAMAERIANQLEIGPIDKVIHIEDVATKEEMEEAIYMRTKEGKHIIPVPVFEIKQDFSGYFLNPLQQIKKNFGKNTQATEDKSIVRPTFSYLGGYTISDTVIGNIASFEAMKMGGISKASAIVVNTAADGIDINLTIIVEYGCEIRKVAASVQKRIIESIDYHTSINVKKVNILVKKIKL